MSRYLVEDVLDLYADDEDVEAAHEVEDEDEEDQPNIELRSECAMGNALAKLATLS